MSVINKMLQDLDARHAAGAASVMPGHHPDADSVWGPTPRTGLSPQRVLLFAALAVLLSAVLAWYGYGRAPATPAQSAAPVAAPLPAAVAAVAAPVAAPEPAPAVAPQAATEPAPPPSPEPAPESAVPAPPITAAAPSARAAAKAPVQLRMDWQLAHPERARAPQTSTAAAVVEPARAPAPAAPSAKAPDSSTDTAPRPAAPSAEVIAQAQSLWNAGQNDAAMDLLVQAVGLAERHAASSPAVVSKLLPLVRELTRMQVAQGRSAAVLDLLTRLEGVLGEAPDLWAIRGNAAQRLGRHQDSVHAYMQALQARPNEQRWLLGCAVSLAALGQTSSATDMAERARAQGPIRPEVLAYLRQLGVTVKERP